MCPGVETRLWVCLGGADKALGVSGGGDKALGVSGGGDKALGVPGGRVM